MESSFFIYPVLFVVGAVLGAWINCYADQFCWTPRFRSPWRVWPSDFLERLNTIQPTSKPRRKSKGPDKIKESEQEPFAKRWLDFVPIIGFLSMSRLGSKLERLPEEERLPGLETRWFWLRPFFVELLFALGICLLFFWEVKHQMLRPDGVGLEPWGTVALRFGVHVVFFGFLLAASLIDIDDMIIPDNLTVIGTLLALCLALLLPQTAPPSMVMQAELVFGQFSPDRNPVQDATFQYKTQPDAVPLNLCSPNPSIDLFGNGFFDPKSRSQFCIMFGLWMFWCFAMLPRVWYFKLPFRKAAAIFCRYLKRTPSTKTILGIGFYFPFVVLLSMEILAGSQNVLTENKVLQLTSLYSALVGMAVGMAIIWATRIIGSVVLGREAMGFGDVTLMGMIGAFVGWQACILIFFLAPIAGMMLLVLNVLVGRVREFPYGPYLCLATFLILIFWNKVWTTVGPYYFELGWWIGVIMAVCLVLLGVLLGLWRFIRDRLFAG